MPINGSLILSAEVVCFFLVAFPRLLAQGKETVHPVMSDARADGIGWVAAREADEPNSGNIIIHKQGQTCHFEDMCKVYNNYCQNGGTCHFDEMICTFCECHVGYTGRRCEQFLGETNYHNQSEAFEGHGDVTVTYSTQERRDANVTSKTTTCALVERRQNNCPLNYGCVHGKCATQPSHGEGLGGVRVWCECDPGWTGWQCHECCDLSCQNNGSCRLHGSRKSCHCSWGFKGELCEIEDKTHPTWLYSIVTPSAILLILLSGILVAVPCFLWRRRFWILIKIAYIIKRTEDTDDSQYLFDAFVSYKSASPGEQQTDEHFVVHTLFPTLEKMNFRLCLHFKDFQPGETIANNIIWAVEKSRRTILVLSPSYVKSEWTRMEYHVAQQQMLKLKTRIVPLIYKDLHQVSQLDRNLKCILDSVTYIKWPGSEDSKKEAKFWDRLRLSLPKKRVITSLSSVPTVNSHGPRQICESTSSSDSGVSMNSALNSDLVVNIPPILDESELTDDVIVMDEYM